MTTPARRARRWALIHLGAGIGLVVGSLIAALLVIAHDYGTIDLLTLTHGARKVTPMACDCIDRDATWEAG